MNKKKIFKKTAALFLGVALAVGSVGCANFVITDNEKDLAQTVATVDISEGLKSDSEYSSVAGEVKAIVKNLSTDISKRDLVAYFLSAGSQYVESYGYEETFNMLMDTLVSREIMIQYAVAYYLKTNSEITAAGCEKYIADQLAKATDEERALLKANPEVLTLKYFLTDGGKEDADSMEAYNLAIYSLKKSFNSSLDSLEEGYIKATEEHEHEGEARTLPTGVKTEKEKYVPMEYDEEVGGDILNYDVYTGRNVVSACGEYEKLDGSTTSTRQKAYNAFLANLQGYNMIGGKDEAKDISKVTSLNYYYVELSSILGQSLVNKYFEELQEKAAENLTEEYVQAKYGEIYAAQKAAYEQSPSAFETAMDGVSDTSFILYGLDGFGFVYNILIPFSTEQENAYTTAKNNKANTQNDLFKIRRNILNGVKAKDVRDSWFSTDEHENYATEREDGWYFFTDQTGKANTKYENLKHYVGLANYHGTVEKDEDGEFVCTPKKLSIDEFIFAFNHYINAVSGEYSLTAQGAKNAAYEANDLADDKGKVSDYDKFVYYRGNVSGLDGATASDYFNKDTAIYRAVSAVNELMFTYSTDTGCLNTYYGYAVSPYGTDFVKEFEYAAQDVVKRGAGNYAVCATDYGWHLVFATYVYKAPEGATGYDVYGGYDATEAETEGTFSNLFYESLKTSAGEKRTTDVQNDVLNRYNNDGSVTLFKDRYKDLLELDKQ